MANVKVTCQYILGGFDMKEISVTELQENVFRMFREKWALLSAGDQEKCNTMTVSWGGVGVFWNKNVVTVYVRPQRYTKEFMDKQETFSLSVLPEEKKEALQYCGKVSGREVADKFTEAGLTKAFSDSTPYPAESELVFVCRKLCEGDIDPKTFMDSKNDAVFYPDKDYHHYYIAEIEKVLVK